MTKLVLLSHFQWLVTENAINVMHKIAFNLFKKSLNLNLIKNFIFKSLIKNFKILLFFNNIFLPHSGTQNHQMTTSLNHLLSQQDKETHQPQNQTHISFQKILNKYITHNTTAQGE